VVPAGAEFKVGVEGASATKLHLLVGQPFYFDTEIRIQYVSLSKPEIAEVAVANSRRLKITGKASGSATIVYWTEGGVPASVDVTVSGNGARGGGALLAALRPLKDEGTPPAEPRPPEAEGTRLAALAAPEPREERDAAAEAAKESVLREEPAFLVAVLPVENLSGKPGPLQEIRQSLAEG